MDTIVGTFGSDSISTTATTGSVQALSGNDGISIWESNGSTLTIDAGDGDDFIAIQIDGRSAPTDVTMTLGEGRDTIKIYQIQQAFTVTDFKVGAQGDVVDFVYAMGQWVAGWDGHTNPFKAGSYARLVQVGADSVLQIDTHRFGQAGSWADWIVFKNTSAQSFTTENFNGAAPDGAPPQDLSLQGTTGADTLNDGFGNDSLYGGAGGDTINTGPGDDLLDGGNGGDWLEDRFGGNDRFYGGAGDDIIQATDFSVATGPTGRAAYMDGGAGNDNIVYSVRSQTGAVLTALGGSGDDLISFGGTATATIDAGAGRDLVYFQDAGATSLTLGAGRDIAIAIAYMPNTGVPFALQTIHFTDFEAGFSGDRLDLSTRIDFVGWDHQSDLVGSKYLSVAQVGANTEILVDPNGGGNWKTKLVLDNVPLTALSPFNLTGLTPNRVNIGQVKSIDSGTFTGTSGDDLLFGDFYGVTLNGAAGNDRLEGTNENDSLDGGADSDLLIGGQRNDSLSGGTGADVLDGGSGSDTLRGDAGADRFEGTLSDLAGDVIVDLQSDDLIKITGLDPAQASFVRSGATLTFSTGESLVLANNPRSDLVASSGGPGAVLLKLLETPKTTAATSFTADFNGDGLSDLAWRNSSGAFTTSRAGLDHARPTMTSNVFATASVDNAWRLAAVDDFNGDGKSDLMWRNVGGVFTLWTSTGTGFTPNTLVDGTVPNDWKVAATGDFNGDGKADLIWRHSSGVFTEWNSTGNGFQKNAYVQGGVDTSWQLAGTGDFNGDGRDDLVWRHSSGTLSLWNGQANGFAPNAFVDGSVANSWSLTAIGDFNGDGKDDLLWRHANGTFTEWQSTEHGFSQNIYVNTVEPDWTLESVGDFNGDGKADLLWRQDSVFTVWQSTGDGFSQNVLIDASVSATWSLASTDYFLA